MRVNGRNILVAVGTTANDLEVIAASTQCDLNIEKEMIEIAGTSGRYKEFVAGLTSWTVSAQCFYVAVTTDQHVNLTKKLLLGSKVLVQFQLNTSTRSNKYETYTGQALIQSISLSAPMNGKATFAISLQGTSDLSLTSAELSIYDETMYNSEGTYIGN